MEKNELDLILETIEEREKEFKELFNNILSQIDDIQKSIKENENEQ